MLRSMTLDNFQSFDHIELDFSGKGSAIKNNAFIYGENGSGKSNLINAVFFLMASSGNIKTVPKDSEQKKISSDDETELARQFRMIGSDGNMKLSFSFSVNGINTAYTIEYDGSGTIVSEKLDSVISSKTGNIFTLNSGEEPILRKGLIKGRTFMGRIRSEISQYWGHRSLISIINQDRRESNDDFMEESLHPRLLDFLKELDNITVETTSFTKIRKGSITLPSGTVSSEQERNLDVMESKISMFFSRLYSDIRGAFFQRKEDGGKIGYELYFRKMIAGEVREIPARLESTGTSKIMYLLGPLLSCVDGKTVFIDEMDTGIHDLLITGMMEQIIPEITGQLIVTTHNTCLMNILSPENVFIIGIDRNGYKKIRCVSSIERIRKNNSIRHKYYEGDLMGIPFIADLGITDILKTGRED